MDFKIVIIDDNLTEKEPFVQNIRMHYKDADYNHVFQNPDKEIRKKTSLLYIVMMSANQLRSDIPLDSIIEMMNEENFFYLDRSNDDFESVVTIIEKIRNHWSTKFDCVLEQWLIRHPEDNNKEAFSEASTGKTYTWEDILVELRNQTPVGKSFEQKLNEYYIYQLNRSKK